MDRTEELRSVLKLFSEGKEVPLEGLSCTDANAGSGATLVNTCDISPTTMRPSSPHPQAPAAPPPPTDFAAGALAIESRFSQTQRLIDRLEKLVDRRALHNDPAAEIDEVSQMFSTDVTEVGDQIKLLVAWVSRNTTKRSQRAGHCEQGMYTCFAATATDAASDHRRD